MTRKCFWRGVFIVVLSVILATPVRASGYPSGGGIVAGAVAVVAAPEVHGLTISTNERQRT